MTCWEHLALNDVLQEINLRVIGLTVALSQIMLNRFNGFDVYHR